MSQDPNALPEFDEVSVSHSFLQSALGSTTDCLKILDLEGRILWISDNGRKLMEIPDFSRVRNTAWTSFLKDETSLAQMKHALQQGREGQTGRFRGLCHTWTGSPKWWDVVVTPILGADGKPFRLLGASRDITHMLQAEHELEQARLCLDATLGSADIGTWTWDIPSNQVVADKNLARLFSIPDGRGPVENFIHSIHPEDQRRVQEKISTALKSRDGMFEMDYRLLLEGNSIRWVTARGKVQFDDQGNPVQFPGVLIDITKRKKQEEAILDLTRKMEVQTRLFEATLSSIADLAYTFDRDARVIYANKPLLKIWGRSLEEVVGKNLFDLKYPEELARRLNGELLQVIHTGNSIRGEISFASADGEMDYHEYIYNPVFSSDGTVVAVAGTTRLVTERKDRERASIDQNNIIALRAEISIDLNRNDSPREVLQCCARSMAHYMDKSLVQIWTLDESGKNVMLQGCAGILAGQKQDSLSRPVADFEFRRVLQTGTPFWFNYIAAESTEEVQWAKERGMGALAVFPILIESRILGAVALFSKEPFSETILQELAPLVASLSQWIQRKETEETVRRSAEQLRLALGAADLGDWQWDPSTNLTTLSDRASAIFGIAPGCAWNRDELRELIIPEDRPLAIDAARNSSTPGRDYDVEYRIKRPDGKQRWIAAKGRNLYREDGTILSMLGVVQDITERKIEGAANQYLAAIVASSEDAIISKSLDGIITSWNAGAERLFGYQPEEIIGKSVTLLIPPYELKEEPIILDRIRRGENIEHYETIRRHKDGSLLDVSLTVSPIKDSNNRIIGASKIARNITDQKKTATELRRRETLYRAIGDSINYGIWVCDKDGRNTYASTSFLKLVGITQEECSEFGWSRILHPDDVEATLEAWKKATREGLFWEREHRFKGVDGDWHPILARGVPIHDDQGKITSWVGINLDILAFKQAEDKLEQARAQLLEHARDLEDRVEKRTAELKETNNQLETLVYSIAHDLRAPLRSMQAYAKTLLEDYSPVLDETAQHYATRIVHSSETMDALVLDLLAYGRIARSEMQLEPVSLESVWKAATDQYEKDIMERQARMETSSSLPFVLANEVTLVQVLANLLGNAIKFVAPEVTPVIRFHTETRDGLVRIWIEDNGIGIAPEYHERIFRVFERLQGKSYPGTGIGLSIVRKGIERMGGHSGVESSPTKGSRFWIELPEARP